MASRECVHEKTILTREDEHVCLDCSLVLPGHDPVLYSLDNHCHLSSSLPPLVDMHALGLAMRKVGGGRREEDSLECIVNVCANNHLPLMIEDYAKDVCRDFFQRSSASMIYFSPSEICSWCIFTSCYKQKVPRTMSEISLCCGTQVKQWRKLQKLCPTQLFPTVFPSDLFPRIRGFFDFGKEEENKIPAIADCIFNLCGSNANSILAVVMLDALERRNGIIDGREKQKIANVCHVSRACMHRLHRECRMQLEKRWSSGCTDM